MEKAIGFDLAAGSYSRYVPAGFDEDARRDSCGDRDTIPGLMCGAGRAAPPSLRQKDETCRHG